MSKKNCRSKVNDKNMIENESECINENKNSSYSNIYSISTFFISFFVSISITFGANDKLEDYITLFVFAVTFPICIFLIKKIKKECEKANGKSNKTINALIEIGTNIGYLNPVLLLFNAISGLCENTCLSIVLSFSLIGLVIMTIIPVFKKYIKKKEHTVMDLFSIDKMEYGENYETAVLEQWKTCVEMANSNSEKRNNSNNIFITINVAILAVISFSIEYKSLLLSLAGLFICFLWIHTLNSYRKLSTTKYDIINEIEKQLPLAPLSYEWKKLNSNNKYLRLTTIEKFIPILFIVLYTISIIVPIGKWLLKIYCECKGGGV